MTYNDHVIENVVSEEPLIEVHVFDLNWKYHADTCLSNVLLEHVGHKLNERKHP
jgi:hypothetical protein